MNFCVYIAFVILPFSIFVFNSKYMINFQLKTFIEIILCSTQFRSTKTYVQIRPNTSLNLNWNE